MTTTPEFPQQSLFKEGSTIEQSLSTLNQLLGPPSALECDELVVKNSQSQIFGGLPLGIFGNQACDDDYVVMKNEDCKDSY
jgi:hypothetical protein